MNYTLICYKPADYNSCSGLTGGEHEIYFSEDWETIVDLWVICLVEDHITDQDEAEWEVTLLIDGVSTITANIEREVETLAKERILIHQANVARENEVIRRATAEKQKQDDLFELQRLTAIYKNNND